jgi:hypothetical protein
MKDQGLERIPASLPGFIRLNGKSFGLVDLEKQVIFISFATAKKNIFFANGLVSVILT